MDEHLEQLSIKVKNFKCFGEQWTGFDKILPINLIIGRNSSGKSSLIDLVECVASPRKITNLGYRGRQPEVLLTDTLRKGELEAHAGIGGLLVEPRVIAQWAGRRFSWKLDHTMKVRTYESITPSWDDAEASQYLDSLARLMSIPLNKREFRRLRSDRDIVPELPSPQPNILLQENGSGATTAIRRFLTKEHLRRDLVRDTMLEALNAIAQPDASFSEIAARQYGEGEDGRWEIFLGDAAKGLIPLSQSGSGLRTILLVLTLLYLVPEIEGKSLDNYIFAFEDLRITCTRRFSDAFSVPERHGTET